MGNWFYIIYDTIEEAQSRNNIYPILVTADGKFALDVTNINDLTEEEENKKVSEITL